VIGYASRTGTRRNLDALRRAGWRLMVSARGPLRPERFRYALDNGAWAAFLRGEPFDVAAFEKAVTLLGPAADWIVLPDIVAGGTASLRFSLDWLDTLRDRPDLSGAQYLLAVQNGMEPRHVAPLLGAETGIEKVRIDSLAGPAVEDFGEILDRRCLKRDARFVGRLA
jgi:hypothetical protein